jgi:hypothetical protein
MACTEITWNQWGGWPFCNYVHPLHLFNGFCDIAKVVIIHRKIWQNLASSIARFNIQIGCSQSSQIGYNQIKHTNRLYVSCINLGGGWGMVYPKKIWLYFFVYWQGVILIG